MPRKTKSRGFIKLSFPRSDPTVSPAENERSSPSRLSRAEPTSGEISRALALYPLETAELRRVTLVMPIVSSYHCFVSDPTKGTLVLGRLVQFASGAYTRNVLHSCDAHDALVTFVRFVPFDGDDLSEQEASEADHWLVPFYQVLVKAIAPPPMIPRVDPAVWIRESASAATAYRRRADYTEPGPLCTALRTMCATSPLPPFESLDQLFDVCFPRSCNSFGNILYFPAVSYGVEEAGKDQDRKCVSWIGGSLSRYYYATGKGDVFVYLWRGVEPVPVLLSMVRVAAPATSFALL